MPPPSEAQDTLHLPPDYYGEELREAYGFWKNTGWVRTTTGSVAANIEYVTEGGSPRAFIKRSGEFSLVLSSIDTSLSTMDTLRRLDVAFNGTGALHPDPIVNGQRDYHKNFHLPWCGVGGKTMVPGYTWMMYPNIYPKIDMYMYCGSRGQKIMFVIRPEGDPANLKMLLSGQDEIDLDVFGNLKLLVQDTWVVLPQAVAYQYDEENNIYDVNWTAEYTTNTSTGEVGFTFDEYDRYKPLVLLIGPPPMMGGPSVFTDGICWSTYYGGVEDDFVFGSRIDASGNYYLTGQTWSNNDFPADPGLVLTSAAPAVIAARFDDDDNLIWSTIYGSSTGDQLGYGCATPPLGGELFIGGSLGGADIPVPNPQPTGRYVNVTLGGSDRAFIASFNSLDGVLSWSTFFGGGGSAVRSLDFDALSNLYVCGSAFAGLPLPTELTPPSGQVSWQQAGSTDGFLVKLNQSFKVAWSTYFGGTGPDQANTVRVGANKVVAAGRTGSTAFQTLSAGGTSAHNHSSSTYSTDVMLEEFNLNGVQQWGSFFSYGGGTDFPAMTLDKNNGDVFLAGIALAGESDMPVSTDAPWSQSPNSSNLEKGYIWQVGADHVRKYSTYVTGSSGSNWLRCIEVNSYGQIYAAGITWATTMAASCWDGLYCELSPQGVGDAYIISLSPAHERSWLTFFGGDSDIGGHAEMIRTLALKGTHRLYAAGNTSSPYDDQNEQFFPLNDELNGAWWDSELDALSGCDAFLTAFCMEGVVGVVENGVVGGSTAVAYQTTSGSIRIVGFPIGAQHALLYDTGGRLVASERFVVSSDGSGLLQFDPLQAGIYLLQIGSRTIPLSLVR